VRTPLVVGNWKMYKTPSQTEALIDALKPLVEGAACDIAVVPPFVCLERAAAAIQGSRIGLAAQNVYWEAEGAYTGEIAVDMLKEVGVTMVIVGHSERRLHFGETDETVNRRAKAVLAGGLTPIIAVGEALQQREAGQTRHVVASQVRGGLDGLSGEQVAGLGIAYEPVWAIGTGRVATPEQAQEVHALIREIIREKFGGWVADRVNVIYGGSVKPDNASGLIGQTDVDGALVGGASLKARDFAAICMSAG